MSIPAPMRHYEIVLLIHPDQSTQVSAMIDRYKKIIEKDNGKIHRQEDWGRKTLEYTIKKVNKAHFLLFNIECNQEALDALKYAFRFNDAVLRDLIIRKDAPVTGASHMMTKPEEEKESRNYNPATTEDYANLDIEE